MATGSKQQQKCLLVEWSFKGPRDMTFVGGGKQSKKHVAPAHIGTHIHMDGSQNPWAMHVLDSEFQNPTVQTIRPVIHTRSEQQNDFCPSGSVDEDTVSEPGQV